MSGQWMRIVKPRQRAIWHETYRFGTLTWCTLRIDKRYVEFRDVPPDGAPTCKLCAWAKVERNEGYVLVPQAVAECWANDSKMKDCLVCPIEAKCHAIANLNLEVRT